MIKVFIILLFISSCAVDQMKSASKLQKYAPIAFDPMQAESLERLAWDGKEQFQGYPSELVLCYQGKFDEALKLLKLQSSKENDPKYWNVIGSCYYWKKDFAKAKFYFEMGLAIDFNNVELQHNLAMVFLMQENFDAAVSRLVKLTEKNSKNLLARWNLALIYYSLRSPELAIIQLKELQNVAPQDPLVGLLLMKSYIAQEKYKLAIESYARIPMQFKDYPELHNFYTYALVKSGDAASAEKNLRRPIAFKEKSDEEFHLELEKYIQNLKIKQRALATQQGGSI